MNTESILNVNASTFNATALTLFHQQYTHNELYRAYCDAIKTNIHTIDCVEKIPFLPISFFKTHKVITGAITEPSVVFESSGTTDTVNAKHYVADAEVYRKSLLNGFESYYGAPENYAILALLPSYLERKNASLVHMVQELMALNSHVVSGFYIDEWAVLTRKIQQLEQAAQKTLLIGVTFALIDFAEANPMPLKHTLVMETGGMKGRKTEWTREQVHEVLKNQFQLTTIHSEYGMTELLSQAYSKGGGIFTPTSTMKVLIRDVNDPFDVQTKGTGCINIIDLANMYSCAFIATEDIGVLHADGSFEVNGRLDHSALRGCSLMAL